MTNKKQSEICWRNTINLIQTSTFRLNINEWFKYEEGTKFQLFWKISKNSHDENTCEEHLFPVKFHEHARSIQRFLWEFCKSVQVRYFSENFCATGTYQRICCYINVKFLLYKTPIIKQFQSFILMKCSAFTDFKLFHRTLKQT